MIIQKIFIFLIVFIMTLCITSINLISAQTENDSLHKEIKHLKGIISKLDSTVTKLQKENQTIITLAEKDIKTAQNLINVSQTVTEIIAVMLAIFSVVGGILISRLMKQSRRVRKEHRILKKDWDISRKEIDKIKNDLLKESKELIQILFYVTEGDTRLYERTEEAIEFYKEALKIREDNSEVYAKLARAYSFLGQSNDAKLNYEKGLVYSPNNTTILNGLARNHLGLKQYDEAEDYYLRALKIDENDNRALWGIGHLYVIKREFDKAELYYKKSLLTDSPYHSNFNLAFVYACKNDRENYLNYSEKALEWWEHKISITGVDDKILWRKAVLMVILKKYDEAKKILLKLKKEYVNSIGRKYAIDLLKILNEIKQNEKIEKLIQDFKTKR